MVSIRDIPKLPDGHKVPKPTTLPDGRLEVTVVGKPYRFYKDEELPVDEKNPLSQLSCTVVRPGGVEVELEAEEIPVPVRYAAMVAWGIALPPEKK